MFLGDHFLRSLISNLTGVPIGGPGGGGGHIHFTLGGGGGGPGGNVMYGNPGDYVWGRGGFDAIVTQLLNQLEGTGPPPMPKANIDKEVQTIQITQKQVGKPSTFTFLQLIFEMIKFHFALYFLLVF